MSDTLTLSEAIRLGAMLKPQAFHELYSPTSGGSCALGAAADALGLLDTEAGGYKSGLVPESWKWALRPAECPLCGTDFRLAPLIARREVQAVIVHLNNFHRWTREQIADFVETLEQKALSASWSTTPARSSKETTTR